ncbi:MAG: hypothetical protein KZQ78_03480 [Candidatus Thiodiazotropha sp. (ex Ustalcina ferruginea)]|nr:hypothetical protein [Candidatus Thiodiazotropha sp. (ex Ustalcina ferruginea)]
MYRSIHTLHHPAICLVVALLTAGLDGCSQQSNNTASTESQSKENHRAQTQTVAKRDLSSFDVCVRLPATDVAGVLGSTPGQTSTKATMLSYASDCTYTIELGDGMKNYAMIWIYSPEMWAPSMAGEIEKIEGLGNEAYLEKESIGSFEKINVLVKGDFMLDTRANTQEEARGLAELALKRLTGKAR